MKHTSQSGRNRQIKIGPRCQVHVGNVNTDRYPVENLSWFDAVEFCNKLSETEQLPPYYRLTIVTRDREGAIEKAEVTILGGRGYRLPTEAEWEYACRAGSKKLWHFGDENNGRDSNFYRSMPFNAKLGSKIEPAPHNPEPAEANSLFGRPKPVGKYPPNDFGLFDMHGNIAEWCQDWSAAYPKSPAVDPQGPATGHQRVFRSGSFQYSAFQTRSAQRFSAPPSFHTANSGFRVARSMPAKSR